MKMWSLSWAAFVLLCIPTCISGEDYYQLLGISKDANSREIRKAFKKLAVVMHPDKNKDDSDSHDRFIKLARAYEVLKDEELRKKYDLYGEDGLSNKNAQPTYHSYSYYRDDFGIYDDDPEIITLNKADFEQSVLNSDTLWFINFYSPMCSHCHLLAPEWRALAKEMEWALRIGAVNCQDEWQLCRQQNINSYPSLYMYPSREQFTGERTLSKLRQFVLDRLPIDLVHVRAPKWDKLIRSNEYYDMSWLLFLCGGKQIEECVSVETRRKIGAMLDGLIAVGSVDCDADEDWCAVMSPKGANIVFWKRRDEVESVEGEFHDINSLDAKEIARAVFDMLPGPSELDVETFNDLHTKLTSLSTSAWLVYFYMGTAEEQTLELKKLPALLPNMRIGRVHCGRYAKLCQTWHVHRYPLFVVLKPGGSYEVYHGRELAHDVAIFARESSTATNLHTLSPEKFRNVLQNNDGSKTAWFVDFYAPWCPPCIRLLPELRKASRHFIDTVNFGTVDCTIHSVFCRQYNIHSYPTTMYFNQSETQVFQGGRTASDIVDFIEEILSPSVEKLTEATFHIKLRNKPPTEMWILDFFAPWCGPCQQLAPQYRQLAKMVSDVPNLHVAEVNCVTEARLCSTQGVTSYPTIRLYPLGSSGLNTVAIFSGYKRDASSLRAWLFSFLPSTVMELNSDSFKEQVLDSDRPWLIDFYTPWCGHCQSFGPEFESVAKKLEGYVRCGKVNCDVHADICVDAYVRGYPTVMLYYPKTRHAGQGHEIQSQRADQILDHVEKVLPRGGKPKHDEF